MPQEMSPGKPTTRRYSEAEKQRAVRAVRGVRQLHHVVASVLHVSHRLFLGPQSASGKANHGGVDDGVVGEDRSDHFWVALHPG